MVIPVQKIADQKNTLRYSGQNYQCKSIEAGFETDNAICKSNKIVK